MLQSDRSLQNGGVKNWIPPGFSGKKFIFSDNIFQGILPALIALCALGHGGQAIRSSRIEGFLLFIRIFDFAIKIKWEISVMLYSLIRDNRGVKKSGKLSNIICTLQMRFQILAFER